jgi:CubicO group peptidase (beta-lactamase class C family)
MNVHLALSFFSIPLALNLLQRGSAPQANLSEDKLKAASRLVEEEVASGGVGAAALLVWRNGVVALERGYGRLSPNSAAPPCRPDSPFLIASISKPVTVTAVMQLVDQGRLSLDDPVKKFFPEFHGEGRERMTVRHLLNHTSGLPDMLPENVELRKRQAPLGEFLAATLRTSLLFPPGTRVSYQSMGILLAAAIVEQVSGQQLDTYLQDRVFGPLKMTHSSMGLGKRRIADTARCELPTTGSYGFMKLADSTWDWNSAYWRNLGAPWGGMHSTVGDIARLLQAMLDGGAPILKPDSASQMINLQTQSLNIPYGLGWKVGSDAFYDGSPAEIFGHAGATGTLCWADPKRQLIFVLFTNRPEVNDKSHLLRRVSRVVADAAQ